MKCDICGRTESECRIKTIKGRNFCPKHLTQWYRYGEFLYSTIYDPNKYILHEDYAEIIIKDKYQNIIAKALIDIEDVDKCKKYKWHLRRNKHNTYANAHIPGEPKKKIQLHQLIMDYYGNLDIDHINHNGLDNRKSNLRIVSHPTNMRNQRNNRKGIKRVGSGNYQVVVTVNYEPHYLGTYTSYEDALIARENFIKQIKD